MGREVKAPLLRIWNNWLEAVDHAASNPHKDYSDKPESRSDNWYNTPSLVAAVDLARSGWPEGALRAMPRVDRITTAVAAQVVQAQVVTDEYPHGRGFDVPTLLTGDPSYWYDLHPNGHGNRPQVKLSISLCQSAGVPARVAEIRGAALAAIAQALELAGRSVMIQADYTTSGSGDGVCDLVTVKDYSAPLDLTNLIFAIGHASSLRRIGFSLWEHSSPEYRAAAGVEPFRSYGTPCDCPVEYRGDIHIGSAYLGDSVDWNNEGSVIKWCHAQLESCGVTLAE